MMMMQRPGIRVGHGPERVRGAAQFLMFERAETAPEDKTDADAPEKQAPVFAAAEAKPRWPVALLDVGRYGGNLMVSSPTGLWIRTLGFGGYPVSRAVIQRFNLTAAQAEELKGNPAAGANLGDSIAPLEPAVEDFIHEIGVALAAYAKGDHSQTIPPDHCRRRRLSTPHGFAGVSARDPVSGRMAGVVHSATNETAQRRETQGCDA